MSNSLVDLAKKLYLEENNGLLGEGCAIQPWCYLQEHQMEAWIEKAKSNSLKESSATKNETTFGAASKPKTGQELYLEHCAKLCGAPINPSCWDDLPLSAQMSWVEAAKAEKGRQNINPVPFSPLASDILNQARSIVSGDRQTVNGKPERSFAQLAQMWSAYLGVPVTDVDCAQMLALLKMVRAKSGVTKGDHFVDQAGYSALAGELAANGAP